MPLCPPIKRAGSAISERQPRLNYLLYFSPALFPVSLSSQCLLDSLFLAWFQVKGVALYLFNNVLCLDLTLEAAQSVLYRFALLNFDFRQLNNTPKPIANLPTDSSEGY